MNEKIVISTNSAVLQSFLNGDLHDGIKIISPPPVEKRAFDVTVSVNFDVQLIIDLTKITALALATWLVSRSKKMKGNHIVKINRKEIPVDDPKAIELIAKEIQNNQSK